MALLHSVLCWLYIFVVINQSMHIRVFRDMLSIRFPPLLMGKTLPVHTAPFSTSIVQFPLLLYTSCVSESLNVVTIVALLAYSNVSVFGVHTENGAYLLRTVSKSIGIHLQFQTAPFSYWSSVNACSVSYETEWPSGVSGQAAQPVPLA